MVPMLGTRFWRKNRPGEQEKQTNRSRLLLQLRHGHVLPRAVGAYDHAHTPPPSVCPHAATTAAGERRLLHASQGRSNPFLQRFLVEDGRGWNGQAHVLVGTHDILVRGPTLPETRSTSKRLSGRGPREALRVVDGLVRRGECNIFGDAHRSGRRPGGRRGNVCPCCARGLRQRGGEAASKRVRLPSLVATFEKIGMSTADATSAGTQLHKTRVKSGNRTRNQFINE